MPRSARPRWSWSEDYPSSFSSVAFWFLRLQRQTKPRPGLTPDLLFFASQTVRKIATAETSEITVASHRLEISTPSPIGSVRIVSVPKKAIHAMFSMRCPSHPTEREAARDVVTNEPDHQRAGDDGQHAGRGQQAPIHAGGRNRAGHDCRNRLGRYRRQRARQQQFDPGEHEAEERGDADAARNQRHQYLDEESRE